VGRLRFLDVDCANFETGAVGTDHPGTSNSAIRGSMGVEDKSYLQLRETVGVIDPDSSVLAKVARK
jgi:hypothetical protein